MLTARVAMRWIYLNGEVLEREAAAVSALDRGLLYGYGLFETMRSYTGRVFRLGEHYQRLSDGASQLALAVPLSLAELSEAVRAVLERNELPDAYLRLTVTAGPDGPPSAQTGGRLPGGDPVEAGNPGGRSTVMLFARALGEYPPELYRRGMGAVVSDVRRNETSPLSRVKSLNYLDNLLAREDARRRGADEAILLNTRGMVAEGSASNVFAVIGERLVTPSIESGALAGITRQVVLELASEAGMEVVESEVEAPVLGGATEAFLTNSIMEVMPLTRLDARPVGSGRPGPVTERLSRLYRERATEEPRT